MKVDNSTALLPWRQTVLSGMLARWEQLWAPPEPLLEEPAVWGDTARASVPDRALAVTLAEETSARNVAEAALRASEERYRHLLEASEATARASSGAIAELGHELRTPMHAMLGLAALLHASPLTPAQRDDVETIRRSGTALLPRSTIFSTAHRPRPASSAWWRARSRCAPASRKRSPCSPPWLTPGSSRFSTAPIRPCQTS